MTETERCARIAEAQIVAGTDNRRVEATIAGIRVGSRRETTDAAEAARCINIARSQLRGDDTDRRIEAIIEAIGRGADAA